MDSVTRALAIYLGLLIVFRVTGKRSLSRATTFDFVLLLVISEAVSSALLAEDQSVTGALISVITMIVADVVLSILRTKWPALDRLLSERAVRLITEGERDEHAMRMERVDLSDILEAGRINNGIASISEIRTAVLESNGEISIAVYPRPTGAGSP